MTVRFGPFLLLALLGAGVPAGVSGVGVLGVGALGVGALGVGALGAQALGSGGAAGGSNSSPAFCSQVYAADSTVVREVARRLGGVLASRIQVGTDMSLPSGAASFTPGATEGRLAISPRGVTGDALAHEIRHIHWALQPDSVIRERSDSLLERPLGWRLASRVESSVTWSLFAQPGALRPDFAASGDAAGLSHGQDMVRMAAVRIVRDSASGGALWTRLANMAERRDAFARSLGPQSAMVPLVTGGAMESALSNMSAFALQSRMNANIAGVAGLPDGMSAQAGRAAWTWRDELSSLVASEIDAYSENPCTGPAAGR